MRIAIILVTYNGSKWLLKCLDSILKSSIESKIFVVDNCSTDNTLEILYEYKGSIEIIQSKENLGFGKANNIALSKALKENFDSFLLLNQDAYLHSNTLEKLMSFASKNTDYGIISPVHLSYENNSLDYGFCNHLKKHHGNFLISEFLLECKKEVYDVSFINAACWLVTKKTLEIVGGFDPIFYHYGEDDNFVHRLHYAKLKLGLLTTCFVNHDRLQKNEVSIIKEIELGYRFALISLCNINKDLETEYKKIKKEFLIAVFQNLVSFKFNLIQKRFKVLKKIKDSLHNIKISRNTNCNNTSFKYLN